MLAPGFALLAALTFGVADFLGGSASRRIALPVVLASRTRDESGRATVGEGVWLAVAAAVVIGLFLVALNEASEADPYWATLTARATTASLLWGSVLVLRPSLRVSGSDRAVLPLVGLLDVLGNLLFAIATTRGLIGVVSVLTSLYPVVTVALARVVHHERLSRVQAFGVVAAFAGVALLAGG